MTDAAERSLELADGEPLRIEAFLASAGPSEAEMAAEAERALADKQGLELQQGELQSHVLADHEAGTHPRVVDAATDRGGARAARRLPRQRRGRPRRRLLERRGRAGVLELRNPRQVTLLRDLQASVLTSTPSYAVTIAEALEAEGVGPDDLALEIGLFGGESWSESMREQLERRLGLRARNFYGLSEVIGPGGPPSARRRPAPTSTRTTSYAR